MSKDILRCENCQYYNYDSSTGTSECNQYDNMTEDEAEKIILMVNLAVLIVKYMNFKRYFYESILYKTFYCVR